MKCQKRQVQDYNSLMWDNQCEPIMIDVEVRLHVLYFDHIFETHKLYYFYRNSSKLVLNWSEIRELHGLR